MSMTTVMVQRWLKELPHSDSVLGQQARDELIEHGRRRMEALCRKMFFKSLDGSPVDYEDVYQESALRLWKSLTDIQPTTVREFFGLAATQIRRVLIDLCRKHLREPPDVAPQMRDASYDPSALAKWTEFHQHVEKLEAPLRDVVELIWYHELTHKESAEILGVDERTVRRRWRKAREQLADYVL
jgi:RNA polymerase sigma factor (sigma-70 family)